MPLREFSQKLSKTVWFFDYDGSLCPHQEVWEHRAYEPKLIWQLLLKLQAKSRAIFWNTGRRPESLASVCPDFMKLPGYFVQGSLYWDETKQEKSFLAPELPLEFVEKAREKFANEVHYRLEVKPTSLRVSPGPGGRFEDLETHVTPLRDITPESWTWIVGGRGAELLFKNCDKATAVNREMPLFPKDSIPIAVGDDLMDRPAIEAALRGGGLAILVGDSCGWITDIEHSPKQIQYFESPDRLHSWLQECILL